MGVEKTYSLYSDLRRSIKTTSGLKFLVTRSVVLCINWGWQFQSWLEVMLSSIHLKNLCLGGVFRKSHTVMVGESRFYGWSHRHQRGSRRHRHASDSQTTGVFTSPRSSFRPCLSFGRPICARPCPVCPVKERDTKETQCDGRVFLCSSSFRCLPGLDPQ